MAEQSVSCLLRHGHPEHLVGLPCELPRLAGQLLRVRQPARAQLGLGGVRRAVQGADEGTGGRGEVGGPAVYARLSSVLGCCPRREP
jgi:hypothetical protein